MQSTNSILEMSVMYSIKLAKNLKSRVRIHNIIVLERQQHLLDEDEGENAIGADSLFVPTSEDPIVQEDHSLSHYKDRYWITYLVEVTTL